MRAGGCNISPAFSELTTEAVDEKPGNHLQ